MKKIFSFLIVFLLAATAFSNVPVRSDVDSMLDLMTSVKNQRQRSLCTVFSFTALLETLVIKKLPFIDPRDLDISEQWIQYVFALQSPTGGGNGAEFEKIFTQVKQYGVSEEVFLPYNGLLWSPSGPQEGLDRCGPLPADSLTQKRCYSSHFSPELIRLDDAQLQQIGYSDFVLARTNARENKGHLDLGNMTSATISKNETKRLLSLGHPIALKIKLYFGSWNITGVEDLDVGSDPDLYESGVVTYPEQGSKDQILSDQHTAIHSVLLIGYDDSVVVNYNKLMNDGTTRSFTRQGVFYFKNSWDKAKYGKNFRINNQRIPGFGMIVQDHAAKGQFYTIQLTN